MGGLLPSWKSFNDDTNNVSRPIQMGPVWMHAAQVSGMPMNTRIWMEDPPVSSYPACIAVKAAQLQSAQAAEAYLRLVREAIFLHGKNIARQEVLDEIAEHLTEQQPGLFNYQVYRQSLQSEDALEAFKTDANEVRSRSINRFPSFVIRSGNQPAIIMTGYRPYHALVQALQQVYPQLPAPRKAENVADYTSYWPSNTERELAEMAITQAV
jgi:predicted DsbA family dithiol-disulfide isomerase